MTQSLKDKAVAFLTQVVAGDIKGAYERFVDPRMRHHNPWFAGDVESLKKGMEEDQRKHPGKEFRIQRALQDGDLVAVHSRLKHPAFEPEMAVVHLFRFEHDRIVEFWDVGQMAPEKIVNKNGMF